MDEWQETLEERLNDLQRLSTHYYELNKPRLSMEMFNRYIRLKAHRDHYRMTGDAVTREYLKGLMEND